MELAGNNDVHRRAAISADQAMQIAKRIKITTRADHTTPQTPSKPDAEPEQFPPYTSSAQRKAYIAQTIAASGTSYLGAREILRQWQQQSNTLIQQTRAMMQELLRRAQPQHEPQQDEPEYDEAEYGEPEQDEPEQDEPEQDEPELGEITRAIDERDLVRAIFAEPASDGAVKLAEIWRAVSAWLAHQLALASTDPHPRTDWHLPHRQASGSVGQMTEQAWIDFTLAKLDVKWMGEWAQGRTYRPEEIRPILAGIYATIRTEGLNRQIDANSEDKRNCLGYEFARPEIANSTYAKKEFNPMGFVQGNGEWEKKQGSALQQAGVGRPQTPSAGSPRTRDDGTWAVTDKQFCLRFNSARDWLSYHRQFGRGSVLDAMLDHIDAMAHDIAGMQVMGPDPAGAMAWLIKQVERDGLAVSPTPSFQEQTKWRINGLRRRFAALFGTPPAPLHARSHKFASGSRRWLADAQLAAIPAPALSALSDVATAELAVHVSAIPQTRMLEPIIAHIASDYDRKQAARAAFLATRFVDGLRDIGWQMEMLGRFWEDHAADRIIHTSGLKGWTDGWGTVLALEFSGMLADQLGRGFDGLAQPLRAGFAQAGLTAQHWDVMGNADCAIDEPEPGVRFIDFVGLARSDDPMIRAAAIKIHGLIMAERDVLVADPEAFEQTLAVKWGVRGPRGPDWTEAGRIAIALHESFPISFMASHLGLLMRGKGGATGRRLTYGAALVAAMTPFGMLRHQLDALAAGRDAVAMDAMTAPGQAAWATAMVQGGGLAIAAQLLFGSDDRVGTDRLSPSDDAATQGENPGKQRSDDNGDETASRYVPEGASWYLHKVFRHAVLMQIALAIDPGIIQKCEAAYHRQRDAIGSDDWWGPGDSVAPGYSPDTQ